MEKRRLTERGGGFGLGRKGIHWRATSEGKNEGREERLSVAETPSIAPAAETSAINGEPLDERVLRAHARFRNLRQAVFASVVVQ